MATVEREQFSSRADPALLARMREIAAENGLDFEAVVENAFLCYCSTEPSPKNKSDDKVMAHFRASVEKNSGLLELLAQ